MKKKMFTKIYSILAMTVVLACVVVGCGGTPNNQAAVGDQSSSTPNVSVGNEATDALGENDTKPAEVTAPTELEVRFGDEGEPFIMRLEENATAAAIARHVGTTDWRLPIYNQDDFENADVMQYYDIPQRYEIPSDPQAVSAELAGEVYYSDPNRIVLFYGDAEIPGEYTKIGSFDASEAFINAVQNNPEQEGWGNKIILISDGQ